MDRLRPPLSHPARALLRELAEAIETNLEPEPPIGSVRLLDYGSGAQPYRPMAERHGWEYVAYDIDASDVDAAASPGLTSTDGSVPSPDGSFGCVLSTQVLEHVPDPDTYLRECRRVLEPGGVLVLTTHGLYPYHGHPSDYWRWTGAGLEKLLLDNGFEVRSLEPIGAGIGAALFLLVKLVADRLPRPLRAVLVAALQPLLQLTVRRSHRADPRTTNAIVFLIRATRPDDDRSGSSSR